MNDISIQPINSVRLSDTTVVHENGSPDSPKPAKRVGSEVDNMKNVSNISIHFDVDDDTKRLIVIVTERESGRVIRTIPASEFEKMQAGDLLKVRA